MEQLDNLNLCELALGRPIVLNFNDKFRFLADERLIRAKSVTIEQHLQPDVEIYNIKLPHYENIPNIVEYFKTGKFTSFEPEMFPTLFANAHFLKLKDITTIMTDMFCKQPRLYANMNDFKTCITKEMFCELMFAKNGKGKMKTKANYLSRHFRIFGNYFELPNLEKKIFFNFPYVWKISKKYQFSKIIRDLEIYFSEHIDDEKFLAQEDMNSNFISHEDFKHLLLLNPKRLQVQRGGERLNHVIYAEFVWYNALKIWLKRHPGSLSPWFETMRYVTDKL